VCEAVSEYAERVKALSEPRIRGEKVWKVTLEYLIEHGHFGAESHIVDNFGKEQTWQLVIGTEVAR
jgi:hypothetical protein